MKYILSILLACMLVLSCATPQKHFNKGNYDKAFTGSLKDIRSKNDRKTKQLLNNSFDALLKENNLKIAELTSEYDLRKWEKAHELYDELIDKYYEADRYLKPVYDTLINALADERDLLAFSIADNYAQRGYDNLEDFEDSGDKYEAQQAFLNFKKVENYQPEFPEINDLLDYTYEEAVVDVVIDVNTWNYRHEWEIKRQFRQLKNHSNPFLKVHFDGIIANPDCEIDLNFDDLRVSETRGRSGSQRFSRQIQDGYETVVDTSGNTVQRPRYIQVEGYVNSLVTTINYDWNVNLLVDRYSNYCNISPRYFNSRVAVNFEEYEISGDPRAVPDQYKVNNSPVNYDINDRRVIEDLISNLYYQIENHLNLR